MNEPPVAPITLRIFRDDFYACLDRRADALFELTDALLTAGPLPSPVHLSCEAVHRRGWGSLYAALRHGHLNEEALRALLPRHSLADEQVVYAVDVSVWPRCDAATSPDRGYYYHPSRHSAGQPIVAGWAYQWLAQLSFARASWTAPLDVQRVHPIENVTAVAVTQITRLIHRLPIDGLVPLVVFDAGYAPVQLQQGLADCRAAILVRLRSGRCFYADPPPPQWTGRPPRHGRKFDCADPTTWSEPTAEHTCADEQYGPVHVRAWAGLHPKVQAHQGRGSREPRPIVRRTLVRVEVSRLPRQTREPQVLWLWWHSPGDLDLDLVWRAYVRRFDLEHTLRFLKQTLLSQADAGLADPAGPPPCAGGPLDMAGAHSIHATAPGAWSSGRPPAALGTLAATRASDALPSAAQRFGASAGARHTRQRAKTRRPVARAAQRPLLRSCRPASGD